MSVATLTNKGQIMLPQAVRQSLGVEAGDKVNFVEDQSGGFRIVALRKDVTALRGRFAGRAATPVSVQDMAEAVRQEAARPSRMSKRSPTRPSRPGK